jgi:hypothetical protein
MNAIRISSVLATIGLLSVICGRIIADPLPGEVLKFQQLPLTGGVPVVPFYAGPFLNLNGLPIPTPTASTAPYPGHDELSTAFATTSNPSAFQGQFMADDFADNFTTPVVHIRWWGSYLNGAQVPPPSGGGVASFLISFETDVPAVSGTTGSFSHPGTAILSQIVTLTTTPLKAGSGNFTESLVPGATPNPTDGPLYQYNAELKLPYSEPINSPLQPAGDPVTWLKIVALAGPNQPSLEWGWHNRDWSIPDPYALVPPTLVPGENIEGILPSTGQNVWHFQDDAVQGAVVITPNSADPTDPKWVFQDVASEKPTFYKEGVDGPTGISNFSKDLAFELYTVPEPSSIVLLSVGAAAIVALRRKQSRN